MATTEAATPTRASQVRRIRIAARIIGTLISVLFLMMLIGDAVVSIQEGSFEGVTIESLFIIVPVLFAVVSFGIAWRWERLGGWLMVLSYLILNFAPNFHAIYVGQDLQFMLDMWLYTLPFLAAGVLFLIAAGLSRKAA